MRGEHARASVKREAPRRRETRGVALFARRIKIKEQRLLEVYFSHPLSRTKYVGKFSKAALFISRNYVSEVSSVVKQI